MDPEERIYSALSGGTPDRIPTLSLLSDPNITNQVFGIKPWPVLKYLESGPVSRFVDNHTRGINRFYDLGMMLFGHQSILANYRLGFDGIWMGYIRMKLRNHAELEDGFGRLYDIVDDGYGNPYMMYRDGLITDQEDWRRYPRPVIAEFTNTSIRIYKLWRMVWKKRIAIVPFVGPGLWENCWQPMGFSRFVVLMKKDPAFVREVVGYFTALSVALVDAFGKAGAKAIGFGDDLAYKSGSMISPAMLEEFYGEGYRQITAAAHRRGAKIWLQCCGNTNDLLGKFIEWGFDGAHAFEPTAGNDLAEARRKVGDKLCLIGNIDITHILVDATEEEVEEAVEKAINDAAGGGFILAPAHTHASISVENVRWMLEVARRMIP